MKKNTLFIISLLFAFLYGCSLPEYKWVNNVYAPSMLKENLAIDMGECKKEANDFYPLPVTVQHPDAAYRRCIASPFARKEVIRAPDYVAYVSNAPDLRQAYANRQDTSLSIEDWGEQHYLRNGRQNGRRLPIKTIVTYPICVEMRVYQQYEYNEYTRVLSVQENNRSEHLNNCMALSGWQYMRVEDIPPRLVTEWHANGQKKREGNIVYDQAEGLWTEWDESGNIISQGNYVKGKKDGPWIEYDKMGLKRIEKIYETGKVQSEIYWNESGNICEDVC